ncbi:MAG: hypothetical protein IPK66_06080 [Rhodospirillales bacterium]|nr:hypothetical protein [Rhodospirillales bacterium]
MTKPCYIDLEQARKVLAEMGVELTARQIKRAAEANAHGRRKLPFFVDPIEGKLKIEKQTLIGVYVRRQVEAERSLKL